MGVTPITKIEFQVSKIDCLYRSRIRLPNHDVENNTDWNRGWKIECWHRSLVLNWRLNIFLILLSFPDLFCCLATLLTLTPLLKLTFLFANSKIHTSKRFYREPGNSIILEMKVLLFISVTSISCCVLHAALILLGERSSHQRGDAFFWNSPARFQPTNIYVIYARTTGLFPTSLTLLQPDDIMGSALPIRSIRGHDKAHLV